MRRKKGINWFTISLIAAITVLIIFIFYTIFIIGEVPILTQGSEKAVTINNARIDGWENGKKSWEFYAKTGWSTVDKNLTVLEDVSSGIVYDNGTILVRSIEAWQIKIMKSSDIIEVFPQKDIDTQKIIKQLYAQVDIQKMVSSSNKTTEINGFTQLWADNLRYDSKSKTSVATGNIRIKDKNREIFASTLELDHKSKIAKILETPKLTGKNFIATGEKMESFLSENRVVIEENVLYIRFGRFGTSRIFCDKIEYFNDTDNAIMTGNLRVLQKNRITTANAATYNSKAQSMDIYGNVKSVITDSKKESILKSDRLSIDLNTKDARATGNTEVTQVGKIAMAPLCIYNSKLKKLELKNGVKVVLEKGHAIIKKETAEKLKNPEIKETLKEKTTISAEEFEIPTESGNTIAKGNVIVNQKGKSSKSNRAEYVDKSEEIIMTDNVFIEKQGEWVKTNKIIVSVKNETFTAYGSVEAGFRLKKSK